MLLYGGHKSDNTLEYKLTLCFVFEPKKKATNYFRVEHIPAGYAWLNVCSPCTPPYHMRANIVQGTAIGLYLLWCDTKKNNKQGPSRGQSGEYLHSSCSRSRIPDTHFSAYEIIIKVNTIITQ